MISLQTSVSIHAATRDTLALILAGGRGSRLGPLTDHRAKPAVPFGGRYRIIDFTLSNCLNSGLRRIGVLTQYKAHSLIRHLQLGWSFLRGDHGEFVEIMPAQQRVAEDAWYAGTADAIHQNLDIVRAHAPTYVLVLAGDHVYRMDYARMIAAHVASRADFTVGCFEAPIAEAGAFGVMEVDETSRIRRFVEKPKAPFPMPGKTDVALASMGIYVFNTSFLIEELLRDAARDDSSHDFGKDIIPRAIVRSTAGAHRFEALSGAAKAYWRDVGTLDAYWSAHQELLGVAPILDLNDSRWPILGFQEQLPPARFGAECGPIRNSMLGAGCELDGAAVEDSVLSCAVRLGRASKLQACVVLNRARIGASCRLRRAIVDQDCVIPDGTVIGEDRASDARRFFVSETGVVLVTPEMLGGRTHPAS